MNSKNPRPVEMMQQETRERVGEGDTALWVVCGSLLCVSLLLGLVIIFFSYTLETKFDT